VGSSFRVGQVAVQGHRGPRGRPAQWALPALGWMVRTARLVLPGRLASPGLRDCRVRPVTKGRRVIRERLGLPVLLEQTELRVRPARPALPGSWGLLAWMVRMERLALVFPGRRGLMAHRALLGRLGSWALRGIRGRMATTGRLGLRAPRGHKDQPGAVVSPPL